MNNPLHGLMGQLGALIGIPDSCVTEVQCVDCGKREIAAHCSWSCNIKTGEHSGPQCGCHTKLKGGALSRPFRAPGWGAQSKTTGGNIQCQKPKN